MGVSATHDADDLFETVAPEGPSVSEPDLEQNAETEPELYPTVEAEVPLSEESEDLEASEEEDLTEEQEEVVDAAAELAEELGAAGKFAKVGAESELGKKLVTEAHMSRTIQSIGGAIIGAFLVIVVLSQVYALDIIQNASGPFGNLISDFVTYGTAAMMLVGVGLIIYGANYAMSMFGNWGGGGGR